MYEDNGQLRQENATLVQKVVTLEHLLKDSDSKCKEIITESQRLTNAVEIKYKSLQKDFMESRTQFESQLSSLKLEKDKSQQKYLEQLSNLQRDLEIEKDKNGRIVRENSQMDIELHETRRKISDNDENLANKVKQIAILDAELRRLKDERENSFDHLKAENTRLRNEVLDLKRAKDEDEIRFKSEIASFKSQQAAEVKRANSELSERISAAVRDKCDVINELQKEKKTLEERISEMEKGHASVYAQKETRLHDAKLEIEKNSKNYLQEVGKKDAEIKSLQDQILALKTSENETKHNNRLEREREFASVSREIKELTDALKAKDKEHSETVAKMISDHKSDLEKSSKNLREEIKKREESVEDLENSLKTLREGHKKESEMLESKVSRVTEDREYWKTQFDRETQDLKSEIENLKQEKFSVITEFKSEQESYENQIKVLQNDLQNLDDEKTSQLENLKSQIVDLKNELKRANQTIEGFKNESEAKKEHTQNSIQNLKDEFRVEKEQLTAKNDKNEGIAKDFERQLKQKEAELIVETRKFEDQIRSMQTENVKTKREAEAAVRKMSDDKERQKILASDEKRQLNEQHQNEIKSFKGEIEKLHRSLEAAENSKIAMTKEYLQKLESAKNDIKIDFKSRQEQFSVVKVELEKEIASLKKTNDKLASECKSFGYEKTKVETTLGLEIEHLQRALDQETEKSVNDSSKLRASLKDIEEKTDQERTELQKTIHKLSGQVKQTSQEKQKLLDEVSKLTSLKDSYEREKMFMEKQLQNSEEEKNIIEEESRKTIMELENTFRYQIEFSVKLDCIFWQLIGYWQIKANSFGIWQELLELKKLPHLIVQVVTHFSQAKLNIQDYFQI